MKKSEIVERPSADGTNKKINLGRMTIQDATKFYTSIEDCMTRWSKDATPVLDGTEHVMWFDRIKHSKATHMNHYAIYTISCAHLLTR